MSSVSSWFNPRGARNIPPRFQYSDPTGAYTRVVGVRDPNSGQYVSRSTPVPIGTPVALDFGAVEHGPLRYNSFDDSYLVPGNQPPPALPDSTYVLAVRLPVLLPPADLAQWTVGGKIAQTALHTLHLAFQQASEAAQGKLPVYRLRTSRQITIASRNNEVHTSPVLELIGWIVRDEQRFGPRTVPPPLPLISGQPGMAALPETPANTDTPPWEEPASASASPPPSASPASPAPANTNNPPGPAANDDDPFSQMEPVDLPARSKPPAF
jgi:hypothetical protein